MPKCLECGNTTHFITAWVEFQVDRFDGEKCVDSYSGDRDRLDEQYPPECTKCNSTDIEGEI